MLKNKVFYENQKSKFKMTIQNLKILLLNFFNLNSELRTNYLNPRILESSNPSNLKNPTGFTLIELMIALLISSILVIQIYNFFDYQQRSYALQDQLQEMQQNLRVAMDALTRDLRIIGYGVPYAASQSTLPRITNATENSITFLANYSDVHTELASDYTSGTRLCVNSKSGFNSSDTIYITDGNNWNQATITGTGTNSSPCTSKDYLDISSALSNTYPVGSTVHVVNTIRYTIDTSKNELERSIDGASAQPVCNNLDYLEFKYYDGSNNIITNPFPYTGVNLTSSQRSSVRKISLLLIGKTSRQEKGHTESGTYNNGTSYSDGYHRTKLQSDVMLRNLAYSP